MRASIDIINVEQFIKAFDCQQKDEQTKKVFERWYRIKKKLMLKKINNKIGE